MPEKKKPVAPARVTSRPSDDVRKVPPPQVPPPPQPATPPKRSSAHIIEIDGAWYVTLKRRAPRGQASFSPLVGPFRSREHALSWAKRHPDA